MTTDNIVNVDKIKEAIAVLLTSTKTKKLLETGEKFSLTIGFHKTPKNSKRFKVVLPKGKITKTSDVCVFVKDLKAKERDYSKTVEHFTEILSKSEHSFTVLPYQQLKTEYQPYEAKISLSNMYDAFLADSRIIRLLPAHLGKAFYSRKKFPIQINLGAQNIAREIDRAVRTEICTVTHKGNNCQICIGTSSMDHEDLLSNIAHAIRSVAPKLPGGEENIKSIYLKLSRGVALPLYRNKVVPDIAELEPEEVTEEVPEADDVTTVMEGRVRAWPDGRIQVVKTTSKRVRIVSNKERINQKKEALKRLKKEKRKKLEVAGKKKKEKSKKVAKKPRLNYSAIQPY